MNRTFMFPTLTCPRCDGRQVDPDTMYCAYCLEKMALWHYHEEMQAQEERANA